MLNISSISYYWLLQAIGDMLIADYHASRADHAQSMELGQNLLFSLNQIGTAIQETNELLVTMNTVMVWVLAMVSFVSGVLIAKIVSDMFSRVMP